MDLKSLNKEFPESELCKIGNRTQTDKPGNGYTRIYYELLKSRKFDKIHFFEIGVYKGASLKMWEEFFPNGIIYGIDNGRLLPNSKIKVGKSCENPSKDDIILLQDGALPSQKYDFSWINSSRIKCCLADQRNQDQLDSALNHFGRNSFDVILDDGHHYPEHQQKSLGCLFKNVKPGGYYIIEDVINFDENCFFGQQKEDSSDLTDIVFRKYLETNKINSIYIPKEQCEYIENNIDDIFLYDAKNRQNSPIIGPSKLLIIKKK